MIRQLAQCPCCQKCEIALDDHPEVVFNPDSTGQSPCAHLVWIDGRYSQWEVDKQGVNRIIGSTEFRWDHSNFNAVDGENVLTSYLKELVEQGTGWQLAPRGAFVQRISAEEKGTSPRGKAITLWDVDGAAVFAANATAFMAELPDFQKTWLAGLDIQGDDSRPRS